MKNQEIKHIITLGPKASKKLKHILKKQSKSFFDLPEEEKREIVETAAKESNRMQQEMMDKQLACEKHNRILIGKNKCVDCEQEPTNPVETSSKLVGEQDAEKVQDEVQDREDKAVNDILFDITELLIRHDLERSTDLKPIGVKIKTLLQSKKVSCKKDKDPNCPCWLDGYITCESENGWNAEDAVRRVLDEVEERIAKQKLVVGMYPVIDKSNKLTKKEQVYWGRRLCEAYNQGLSKALAELRGKDR